MSNTTPLFLQYIAAIAPACSFIVATITVVVIWRGNTTSQKSNNAWEVYKQYTNEEIKQARITVRTLMEDLNWQKIVADYRAYRTYFQLDSPAGLGPGKEPHTQQELEVKNERKKQELEVHSLLAFYHQVGLLLERKLLPEDFTLQLLGGGLADRWEFLAPIPQFYPQQRSYMGMYYLYERYLSWKEHIRPESFASPLRTPSGDNALHYREGVEV